MLHSNLIFLNLDDFFFDPDLWWESITSRRKVSNRSFTGRWLSHSLNRRQVKYYFEFFFLRSIWCYKSAENVKVYRREIKTHTKKVLFMLEVSHPTYSQSRTFQTTFTQTTWEFRPFMWIFLNLYIYNDFELNFVMYVHKKIS